MNLKKSKFVIILILILLPLLTLNRRVKELFNVEMYTSINENFSTSIRMGVYKCAYEVIKNEWIWGYGIGDSQRVLNFCYSYESNVLLKNRFNSHNQYLDVFIKTGIFGLVIFIYFLFMNFKKARENQNRLATFVLGFFCILFFTENILSRQSGVILFFFLLSFLNQESLEIKLKKNEVSKSKPL
jgi:O-antigen ligase